MAILFRFTLIFLLLGCSDNQDKNINSTKNIKSNARLFFKYHDLNGDGKISHTELTKMRNKIPRQYQISRSDAKNYFNLFDENKDGYISIKEFQEIQINKMKCLNENSGNELSREQLSRNITKC